MNKQIELPKISRKAMSTIGKIAKRNGLTKEEVFAYIDKILRGRAVSKHSLLTF